MGERQIKSKERVAHYGEVYTAEREVNAMLDLVKQETERVDSRFLEPACGDGNFLAEILRRKLKAAKRAARLPKRKAIDPHAFERAAVTAASSIYGVDILQDNVEACRERMFRIWDEAYTAVCKGEASDQCREAVRYILRGNIVCGNSLTMRRAGSDGTDTDKPIIFPEWSMVGDRMKRRDFRFDALLEDREPGAEYDLSLWEYDAAEKAYIPKPIAEFPLTDYRRVQEYGEFPL